MNKNRKLKKKKSIYIFIKMKSRFTLSSPLRNSKAISDQEQELPPEILNFYENFINLKFLKNVEIVSYENIEETLQTYTVRFLNLMMIIR